MYDSGIIYNNFFVPYIVFCYSKTFKNVRYRIFKIIFKLPVIFILEIRIEISSSEIAQIGASRAADRKDPRSNLCSGGTLLFFKLKTKFL